MFAILVVFFIVISTAATLHVRVNMLRSAAQAAAALRPLAGPYASILFAVGLFGASMLAAVCRAGNGLFDSEAFGFEGRVEHLFAKRQSLSESLRSWWFWERPSR